MFDYKIKYVNCIMTNLFIFRRDLRINDNTALYFATKDATESNTTVLPIFIFDPRQVKSNKYKSDASVQFMINCLKELNDTVPISVFYGENDEILNTVLQKYNVKKVFFNKDTSHYARKRDAQVMKVCKKINVDVYTYEDYNLHSLDDPQLRTSTGNIYTVYTPFANKAKTLTVNDLLPKVKFTDWKRVNTDFNLKKAEEEFVHTPPQDMLVSGGHSEGLRLLHKTRVMQKDYDTTRNDTTKTTSLLSAHIKFGTLSIREIYHYFKKLKYDSLISQLYWNEFYDYLLYHLPYERTLGNSNFKEINIQWENNNAYLEAWKQGRTGFPFIDAGMRQLLAEGYMHNRARMAVANFLAFILHIDWRKGEMHFAKHLVDYDVAQNNGNWQWSTGVGVDRSGYLRIFNPYTQSTKHDINCEYIKKYVPELESVSAEDIHKWEKKHVNYNVYIKPIVDYTTQRSKAQKMYKK